MTQKDDLLDNDLLENTTKEDTRWYSNVVLFICWFTLLAGYSNFFSFNLKFTLGAVLLILSTFLVFFRPRIGFYSTLAMLVLGSFNVIHHMGFTISMTFGNGSSSSEFSIDLIYLLLVIVHLGLNTKFWLVVTKQTPNHSMTQNIGDNRFIKKYQSKSEKELNEIVKSDKYSEEAIRAVKEILKNRAQEDNT